MDSEDEQSPAYEVLIEPEAHEEMTEAYQWYQNRKPGLGSDFLAALNERLAAIERDPTVYPVIRKHKQIDVRRALLRRFPYSLIYFVKGQTVIIISCFHASRDPKKWQQRADNSDNDK